MKIPEFFIDATQSTNRFILVEEYDLIYLAETAERALLADIDLLHSSMRKAPGIISGEGFNRVISSLENTLHEVQNMLNAFNSEDPNSGLKPLESLNSL